MKEPTAGPLLLRLLGGMTLFFLLSCGDTKEKAGIKPYVQSLSPPVHISHRGGRDIAPENTLYAFDVAVNEYQTDVLEIDVHPTADGEIVVIHDETVDRTTEAIGLVREMTLAEIKGLDAAYRFDPDGDGSYPLRGQGIRIPTLDEAFEAFPAMHFNIEIKEQDPVQIESDVAERVRTYGMEDLVCWGSSYDASAKRLKELMPEVCAYYPTAASVCFYLSVLDGEDPLEECDQYDVLNIPERNAVSELILAAHDKGIPIYVWTIDDQATMESLFAAGVDGIMTDRPDILREVIDGLPSH